MPGQSRVPVCTTVDLARGTVAKIRSVHQIVHTTAQAYNISCDSTINIPKSDGHPKSYGPFVRAFNITGYPCNRVRCLLYE